MTRPLRFARTDALALVEYNHDVFERFVRRVRHLPKKAAMRRRGIGHESLFDTLVHILNVQEVWLAYIVRGRHTDKELGALFEETRRHPTTWKGFDEYSDRVWTEVRGTVRGLTPRTLTRKVKAFWMPGSYTIRDALLQTTMEEAHHLGEIIGALWQDERKSPGMTWIEVRHQSSSKVRRRS